jgi:hypothetical protein
LNNSSTPLRLSRFSFHAVVETFRAVTLLFSAPSARHICRNAIAKEISAPVGAASSAGFQNMPLLNGA